MSFKLQSILAALLMICVAYFRDVSCIDQLDNNYKLSQLSGIGINYQQTTHSTLDNAPYFVHQQGYNYLTPASTYKTFSSPQPKYHTSQTAPLALSLHTDDYQKFDKTAQTFFVPRTQNLAILGNALNQKHQYYVPRSNILKAENKEINIPQTENGPTHEAETKAANPIEDQRNWTPLTVAEDASNFYKQQSFFKQELPNQQNAKLPLEDTSSFGNHKTKTYSKEELTNPITENEISSLKALPTTPETSFTSSCAQNAQSVQQSNAAQLPQPLQFMPTAEAPSLLNKQNEYSVNLERQRRLQVLRSLLAEYLALTLQSDPQATTVQESRYTTSTNLPAISSASPNVGLSSLNDELKPAIIATQTPTSNIARKPHSIYGAPFLNYPVKSSSNSFKKKK